MSDSVVNERTLNIALAGFLISSLPVEKQRIPRQWLQRLHHLPENCEEALAGGNSECEEEIKAEKLLRKLLIALLKTDLPDIFSEPPPLGPLPQCEDEVPTLAPPTMQWATEIEKSEVPEKMQQPSSSKLCTPSEFFSLQPAPSHGAFCYGAVFSEL